MKNYGELLGTLIKCKTVYNKSFEEDQFLKFRRTLEKMFPVLYNCSEFKLLGDGALLYKIKGKDEDRNILVMSHHDVVDGTGNWSFDPFSGEVKDGKLLGRGTVDTKTSFFAELMAMEELLEEGFKPQVNIYIASSNNEEVAGDGISEVKKYLEKEKIKLELVLDEGGAIIDPPLPGIDKKAAMIAVHEKGRTVIECIAKEKEGHGSFKLEKNSIVRLSNFITKITERNIFERKLYEEVKIMFKELSKEMNFKEKIIFSNVEFLFPIMKRIIPKVSKEATELLGTTCTFTTIKGDKYSEVKESKATMLLRAITEEDLNKDIEKISSLAKSFDIEVKIKSNEMPKAANIKDKNYFYVKETIKKVFGEIPVAPYILAAGTDSRHLTDICPCTLRFAPIVLSKEQFKSVHNVNENIDLEVVGQAVSFYKELIKNYK